MNEWTGPTPRTVADLRALPGSPAPAPSVFELARLPRLELLARAFRASAGHVLLQDNLATYSRERLVDIILGKAQ